MNVLRKAAFTTSTVGAISLLLMQGCQPPTPDKTQAIAHTSDSSGSERTMGEDPAINPAVEQQPVRIGVLAIDSAVSVHQRYAPLVDYLSKTINRSFELVPLTQESQFSEVEAGKLDFITNNSLAAVQVQRLYDTQFLVTHSRPDSGIQFSSLIVVKTGSGIESLDDLRGKRVACVDFETAAAGCLFQVYHLRQDGVDPFKDFSEFIENPSQDSIVLAVLNGAIDAGFIRTGQLEKMVETGLLPNLNDIAILDQANDEFVYAHTTALYPEWPIAALSTTDPNLVNAVKTALLTIPSDHPALAAANVEGFVEAVDYQSIDNLIETLQLKSWDAD